MAGPKSKKANGRTKEANTKEKRLEKRAKGLADIEQLEKAVADLVRVTHPHPACRQSSLGLVGEKVRRDAHR